MTSLKQSRERQSSWCALLVVMGGVFLSTMDSGMVNIAIPTIMRHFNLAIEKTELVVTTYLLTITVTLVFWGRIADRKGLKRVYLSGLLVFSFGAWLCCFVETYTLLISSRFIQGLGASMMMASGPAIIKTSFPVGKLGRNLGLVGVATACGLLTGPLVCGHLLMHFSWRSIFVLLGSLSFVVCCAGFVLLRPIVSRRKPQQTGGFDWAGGLCWVAIVILVVNILQGVNQFSLLTTGFKSCILVCLLVFFRSVEGKASYPILPQQIFQNRYYWVAIVTAALSFLSLFSVLVLVPFYLEYVQGFSSKQIGMVMMAVPGTLILLSPSSGYLYDKIGAKYLTSFGLLVSCCALFGLSELTDVSVTLWIVFLLAVMGAGQSIFLSPNSASVLSRIGDERVGATAGILATARNFGMVVGATVVTMLFAYFSLGFSHGVGSIALQHLDPALFMQGFGLSLKCISGMALVACLVSMLRD